MKQIISICIFLTSGLNTVFPQTSFIKGQTYICQRTVDTIMIDGIGNEASWQKAKWSNYFVNIEGDKKSAPYLDTQVKMLWDDDYFYFYAKLDEPHIWATLKQRDTVIYWDNDFELFIDPNGDTHNYYELEVNALNTVWDLMLTKPYRDGGKAITSWDISGLKTAVHIEGTLNNTNDTDQFWSVEVAIPWENLLETFPKKQREIAGKEMRLNFSRVQWETDIVEGKYIKKKQPEYNWVWSPQRAIAMHEPEFWGRVYFSPEQAGSKKEIEFDEESEQIRQLLYSIHRKQRSLLKTTGSFSTSKDELLDPIPQLNYALIEWTLEADQYWYHVKMKDVFNPSVFWHIDGTGRIWKENVAN